MAEDEQKPNNIPNHLDNLGVMCEIRKEEDKWSKGAGGRGRDYCAPLAFKKNCHTCCVMHKL